MYGVFLCLFVCKGKHGVHYSILYTQPHILFNKMCFFPYAQVNTAKSNRWQFIKHFVAHFFRSYFRRLNHKDDLIIFVVVDFGGIIWNVEIKRRSLICIPGAKNVDANAPQINFLPATKLKIVSNYFSIIHNFGVSLLIVEQQQKIHGILKRSLKIK